MDKPGNDRSGDEARADGPSLLMLELSSHEKLIWSGRPHLTKPLVWQSVPKAFVGLGFIRVSLNLGRPSANRRVPRDRSG